MMTPKSKQAVTSETGDKSADEGECSANTVQIITFEFLLHACGLLPPDSATLFVRLLHKIYLTVVFALYTCTLLGQMAVVYVYWGNIPVISTTVGNMSALILAVLACAYFLRNQEKYMGLIDLLKMEFVAKVASKYVKFIRHTDRQMKLYLWISVPIVMALGIIWIAAPFVNMDASSGSSSNVTREENSLKRMVFAMWVPFGIEDSPQFEIFIGLQMIILSLPMVMLSAVDLTFLSLLGHAAAQFKVLCAMLRDMHENISEGVSHRTEHTSPLHLTADDSSAKETLTSANDTICHESGSEISGNPCFERLQEDCHVIIDPFKMYLVSCIRRHQDLIA
jgi:hypothetical protein